MKTAIDGANEMTFVQIKGEGQENIQYFSKNFGPSFWVTKDEQFFSVAFANS